MVRNKRSYYAVIPASVRYDKKLPMGARLLYGELTALANDKGYCWATNKYFAGLYDVAVTTISNWISSLEKRGHIRRVIVYKGDSKEVKERRIYISPPQENCDTPPKNLGEAPAENWETPPPKNCKENNTVSNITFNTTRDKDIGPNGPVGKADAKTPTVPYQEIADLYTQICTSLPTLRSITAKRKKHLRARWKQFKYDISEFEKVFRKVAASGFCQGQNDRGWRADFDWLIRNDHNMIKVLEGKYDNPRVVQMPKRKEVDLNELYIKNHRKRWGDAAIY